MFKLKSALKKDENKKPFDNNAYQEKTKLKDLIAIMIAEYMVILPIIIGAILVFGFILWLMSEFWLI